jgi:hypothetical protein
VNPAIQTAGVVGVHIHSHVYAADVVSLPSSVEVCPIWRAAITVIEVALNRILYVGAPGSIDVVVRILVESVIGQTHLS